MMPYLGQIVEDDLLDMNIVRSAWQEIKVAADRHNDPDNSLLLLAMNTLHRRQFREPAPQCGVCRWCAG